MLYMHVYQQWHGCMYWYVRPSHTQDIQKYVALLKGWGPLSQRSHPNCVVIHWTLLFSTFHFYINFFFTFCDNKNVSKCLGLLRCLELHLDSCVETCKHIAAHCYVCYSLCRFFSFSVILHSCVILKRWSSLSPFCVWSLDFHLLSKSVTLALGFSASSTELTWRLPLLHDLRALGAKLEAWL